MIDGVDNCPLEANPSQTDTERMEWVMSAIKMMTVMVLPMISITALLRTLIN
ncbi:MAG: hypothetical protein CM15mP74_06380 [Halieaceae bacterium]|nr:MAG: hypothetical protein CM15mP74_06380 [Halieaceae bacterium]